MQSFQDKAKALLKRVHDFEKDPKKDGNRLPSDAYFLDADTVLAYKRAKGDGRYPYACDGRTLWAYSSGNIAVEESLFNIFLDSREGKEPFLCFFAGEKQKKGYLPISLLGIGRQPMETDVKRFTVFTPQAVYYFTETKAFVSCVRAFTDADKRICFSVYMENLSKKKLDTYLCAYFNPFMRHTTAEGFEDKWYKACTRTDYGYKFRVTEYFGRKNCAQHYLTLREVGTDGASFTTSRYGFTGGMNEALNCSTALFSGKIENQQAHTEFTDMAIATGIKTLCLNKGESFRQDFVLAVSDDEKACEQLAVKDTDVALALDTHVANAEEKTANSQMKTLGIRFAGLEGELQGRDETFNNFLNNVVRQVEFCARAKNYAGPFIGIRDIFQQVESAIAWIPDYCRGKIVEALNYIGDNGRPPRQYSYPANATTPPSMDLRPFIDQGVWIISTVYTYLSYTGDYSILDEECGYYHFEGNTVQLCSQRDSVLAHLLRITDYLVSNIDENTNCLRALYGDWNDALDGLGNTQKEGQEYGNGVSVMASEQLYRNLGEMAEICRKLGKHEDKATSYLAIRDTLKKGLREHAVVTNGTERKILHGWGDDKSFFVGSYKDNDGYSREGLTANAYWILSGLHKEYGEIIPDVLKAYDKLDSKYGLKTFEPYFSSENDKVGRINRLPKGTAENGATYIHATLFAIWSLFEIGESKRAWEQIYKILPITHDFISTTPFVMPNSYIHNEEKGFDGESMSDWFTGSGCVLIKALIGGVFGVRPTLDGVAVSTSAYMPCQEANVTLKLKKSPVRISYKNEGAGERKYYLNGQLVAGKDGVYLTESDLDGKEYVIEIKD